MTEGATWAWLVDLMGEDAAVTLVLAHGGRAVKVPSSFAPDRKLARLLGEPAARALIDARGGEVIDIPLARRPVGTILLARGVPPVEVAERLGVTRQAVGRWQRSMRDAEDDLAQMRLFA